jgi:hypothetical protein
LLAGQVIRRFRLGFKVLVPLVWLFSHLFDLTVSLNVFWFSVFSIICQIVRLNIFFSFLLFSGRMVWLIRHKKATGFWMPVALGEEISGIKKPRGQEFARGRLPELGKAKYGQAHSAQGDHYRQRQQI